MQLLIYKKITFVLTSFICTNKRNKLKKETMSILYVSDEFRTNSLSLMPGGSNVVVEYHSGDKFGYSKVKYPASYMAKVSPTDIIHGKVSRVYIDGKEVNLPKFIQQVKNNIL
jgi:hypothetical protein